jgi:hypothetical protein
MNKVISLVSFFALVSPSFAAGAAEYKADDYTSYGYAAGASAIFGTNLKGGLRGSHVAANHHKENSYYPGYTAIPSQKDK